MALAFRIRLPGRDCFFTGPAADSAVTDLELIKSLIRQLANAPERMAGRDPPLDRDVGEQGAAALLLASYQRMGSCPILAEVAWFFSEL